MNRLLVFAACVMALAAARVVRSDEPLPSGNSPALDSAVPYLRSEAPGQEFLDLDAYPLEPLQSGPAASSAYDTATYGEDVWFWQCLPTGLIYPAYLASTKQSRFSSNFVNMKGDGWLWDAELGTRVSLLRFGTLDPNLPDGFELEAEGSAQGRLDLAEEVDVRSVDFRGGVPLVYGSGPRRWKIAYYHISSHLGDEFLLKNPGYPRLNFVRDVLTFGYTRYLTPRWRAYGEVGWAFHADISEPWEVQFGLDYAPFGPTGIRGAPFLAMNGHLRQEVDFSGAFTLQAGWAWRSNVSTPLLRAGVQYYRGKSNQYSFFNDHEEQFGLALWYDF